MAPAESPGRRGRTAIDGVLGLIVVLLIVQMWLLTAALESFLAGHPETAVPATVTSGVLLLGCVALYRFVVHVDRDGRRPDA